MTEFNRRKFLLGLAATTAAPYLLSKGRKAEASSTSWQGAYVQSRISHRDLVQDEGQVFDLSVASGDPVPTGVILWTHLRPERIQSGEPLYFQVALDADFQQLVVEGQVAARHIGPASDHTVKVDLEGDLAPDLRYYYRFIYGNVASRTGRCRTTPASGAYPYSLKLAMITCQDYTNGYYGAFDHVAADDSIDYVVHLGDFIYESVGDPRFQDLPYEDRLITLPSGQPLAFDLQDYRHLYRTYRSDRSLQRAMEQHTWIMTTDDHETCNDCYWDYQQDTLGCPDHPYTTDAAYSGNLDLRRQLKLDSQRAWAEYAPARITVNESATHPFEYSRIYRDFRFGNLVNLYMLDTRTYRTAHPCGEGDVMERYVPFGCSTLDKPGQSMMGEQQREWLINSMSASNTRWNVLGNQTFMGRLGIDLGDQYKLPFNVDAWDGYTAERDLLLNEIQANHVDNFVVLTGDLHSYIASQVKKDYSDLAFWHFDNQVGVEFMTPSITSAGLFDMLNAQTPDPEINNFLLDALGAGTVRTTNPHIRFFNSRLHGYSTIEFRDSYCEWIAYAVSKDSNAEMPERKALGRFRKYESWPFLARQSVWGY
ncbi:alkaline phosphatase D family protein [Marinobacteraceae bacterium S3BR75-40.1]